MFDFSHAGNILLSFILVTMIGGVLTHYLQQRRDNVTRLEATLNAIRELIREIDVLYRTSKQIKRRLRSRMQLIEQIFYIEKDFFEKCMDDLISTQLSFETSRQMVLSRPDLFLPIRSKRIAVLIAYAESYLNAIIAEFERGQIIREDQGYRMPFPDSSCETTCPALKDFLGPRWHPPQLSQPPSAASTIEQTAEAVEKTNTAAASTTTENIEETAERANTAAARYQAWRRLRQVSRDYNLNTKQPRNRRYRSLADSCIRIAIKDMREELVERSQPPAKRFATWLVVEPTAPTKAKSLPL